MSKVIHKFFFENNLSCEIKRGECGATVINGWHCSGKLLPQLCSAKLQFEIKWKKLPTSGWERK